MDIVGLIIKYNAQSNGREKLCRLLQYISKFGWWYMDRMKKNPEMVQKLKNLESNLADARKVMRLGLSLDMAQGALKSIHLTDLLLRFTLTVSKIAFGCYLLIDHLLWLHKMNWVKVDAKKWMQTGARFWVVALACGVTRDLYDISEVLQREYRKRESLKKSRSNQNTPYASGGSGGKSNEGAIKMAGRLVSNNKPLVLDTVKNLFDFILPLSMLGLINVSAGTVGLAGTLTSAINIVTILDPVLKIVPA